MTRVRNEPPLVRERRLEPAEHLVQRLGETGDLVAPRWNGQPGRGDGADAGRLPTQRLDGTQRARGERVTGTTCKQQRNRAAEHELAEESLQCRLARFERPREDDGARLAAGSDTEHPPATARRL